MSGISFDRIFCRLSDFVFLIDFVLNFGGAFLSSTFFKERAFLIFIWRERLLTDIYVERAFLRSTIFNIIEHIKDLFFALN